MARLGETNAERDTWPRRKISRSRRTTSWGQLGELKREQFNLRFQSATNQLEKPSRVREVRRTIARIKTLQVARSRDAAKA